MKPVIKALPSEMPSNLSVQLDVAIEAFVHPNGPLHATSNTNNPTLLCTYNYDKNSLHFSATTGMFTISIKPLIIISVLL